MKNKKETNTNKGEFPVIETKSFYKALRDYITNLDKYCLWSFVVSMILALGIYCFQNDILFHFANAAVYCFDHCPTLIGFGIAVYAFLINMNKDNEDFKKRVGMTVLVRGREKTVAAYFFAGIIWFIFVMLVDYILAVIIQANDSDIMFTIFCGQLIYTLCIFIDLLLKLFSFHTFIFPKEE